MKLFFTSFLCGLMLLSAQLSFAQYHTCGTTMEDQQMGLEQLTANRLAIQRVATSRGVVTYIPIQPHLLALDDGSQRIGYTEILEMFCQLNEIFEEQEIQFYMFGNPLLINNTDAFTDPQDFRNSRTFTRAKVNGAINMFFVGTINTTADGGRTLGYYRGGSSDYIVIRNANTTDESTVAHELGHFFTLAHPFFGWENNPWEADDYEGEPVPTRAPNGSTLNEKADSSNCTTAADRICDTPPDYLFAFSDGQSGCAPFNQNALDPDSMAVDPMEVNMMSYFSGCRDYGFTTGQKNAILADLNSSRRNAINNGYIPPILDAPVSASTLISPAEGERTAFFDEITFTWSSVENADRYLFQIDENRTFKLRPRQFVVTDTTITLTTVFDQNDRLYWRAIPFNDYRTCFEDVDEIQFRTGRESVLTSISEIESISGLSIFPNPVSSNQMLQMQFDTEEIFRGSIFLTALDGRRIKTLADQDFVYGKNNLELDIRGLNPGIYFISIESEKGVINRKVLISE